MMHTYEGLADALVGELQNIEFSGDLVNSRGDSQREVICRSFRIDDPTSIDITFPSRKFNNDYALFEWLWYVSTDKSVHNISKLAKIWDIIKDEDGNVESNYGNYMFTHEDDSISQWEWCKHELLDDNDSRRATIPINQPKHKTLNKLDIPCTQYIQFFIRDNKLHLSVNMRSCDIVYGMCNDIFTFSLMQQLMLNELRVDMPDLKLGYYYHTVGSLHLYKKHFQMSTDILKEFKDWRWSSMLRYRLNPELTYLDVNDIIGTTLNEQLDKQQIYSFVREQVERLFV